MTRHRLNELTSERLEGIRSDWSSFAGEDEVAVELSAAFDWASQHLHEENNNSQALELRNEDTGDADAILELVTSKRGAMTKLLKVYYSPRFWGTGAGNDDVDALADIFVGAFSEVVRRTARSGVVQEVKVYGRSDHMYEILSLIATKWVEDDSWSVAMEGRWLRLAKAS